MLFYLTAYAVDHAKFKPNYSFSNGLDRDINVDSEYIKGIENLYSTYKINL